MIKLPFLKNLSSVKEEDYNTNLIAIDIGTETLKTLLFSVSPLGIEVHKVSRIQQQQNAMSKGIITNLNTVLSNCRLAIEEVTEGLTEDQFPEKLVLGLAGEQVQGVSIIVNYEREDKYDEEVTQKEQDKIIEKVHEQIVANGKDDLARRTGLLNEDIEILHITTTGMEIGGMSVDSLVGFRGKSVKLYFYASFAPKTYVESLINVSNSLGMEMLGIVAQPFAVARAFAGSRNKDFSAIFIDIGGGTTDVAVVNHGNITDTQMFAFGGRVFTKELARAMNLDYRHAEARKIKYSNNELEGKIQQDVKDVMYSTSELWMRSLKAALEMCQEVEVFPTQIYLCGGGVLLPEIRKVMLEFPWTKLLPFGSIPKVNIFLPQRLDLITDHSGKLNNAFDVTPAGLARFAYDKIIKPESFYE